MATSAGGDQEPEQAPGLTAFQVEVARLFFTLPASSGFLLAGGAALLAQRLTDRPTHDLDFFTAPGCGDVTVARQEFEIAAAQQKWSVERIQQTETFARLLVRRGDDDLLVDLAWDAPPGRPASVTIAGPTYDPEELAGRKMIAVFDRAEARDFVDVYRLAQRFSADLLLARAAELDAGFDSAIFADMLATLARFTDADLPVPSEQFAQLRRFFADWRAELTRDDQAAT
jgi:hypothetical protein